MSVSIHDLMEAEPREGDAPFSVHIAEAGSDFLALGAALEQDVFAEVFGLSTADVQSHYSLYDESSTFVLLADRSACVLAGAIRLVRWSDLGLPTFVEAKKHQQWDRSMVDAYEHHAWDEAPTRILDVATAALRPSYRGNGLANIALAHGTYWQSLRTDCLRWVSLLEEAVMHSMMSLGLPWKPLCGLGPAEHEGSAATVPVTVTLKEAAPAFVGADAENGSGIEALVSLPPLTLTESDRSVLATAREHLSA